MDRIGSVIDGILAVPKMSRAERSARARCIALLFQTANDLDHERAEIYVQLTAEIPLDKLAAAVLTTISIHQYPNVPTIGELWNAARKAAGMDREQYRAGRYLPAPRDWPPTGKRHAIEAGLFEPMPKHALRLLSGAFPELEAGEIDEKETPK